MSYIGNSPGVASQRVETAFTATASQTVFTPSSGYTLGYCDVYYNGVKLVNGDDYTAADGVSITLATAAAAGDSVVVVASFPRGLTDGYLKAEADAKYVALTGDQTVAGVKTFSGSATIVNGNLGVGTSSVLGNSTFNAALGIVVRNQSTSMGYFQTYNANAGSNLKTWRWGGDSSGNLLFETVNDAYSSATGRALLDSAGNFAVGTNSASGIRLRVLNQTSISGRVQVAYIGGASSWSANGAEELGIGFSGIRSVYTGADDWALAFTTGTSAQYAAGTQVERVRIESGGDLRLRTYVDSVTGSVPPAIKFYTEQTNGQAATLAKIRATSTGNWDGALIFETKASNGTPDNTTTERARIDSSGNLLVNTTTRTAASINSSGTLQVNREMMAVGSLAGIFWENRSGGVTSSSNWYGWYATGSTILLYNGNANIASINTTSGAYTALSDANKKKDFEDSGIGLAAVMQLKPTLFRMLDDAEDAPKQLGFIAQEVNEAIPQAYVESTMVDAGGKNSTYIGLNDRPIIAVLTKAIQEQQAIIEQLRADVQALKEAA